MDDNKHSRAVPFTSLLLGCLLAALGPWIIVRQHQVVARAAGNSKWPHVRGVISASEVVRTTSGNGGSPRVRHYRTRLNYVYSVDGQTYTGHRHSFETPPAMTSQHLASSYPIGRKVDVYYDPRDPRNSVLQRGERPSESSAIGYVLAGFVTAAGCTLLALSLWRFWRLPMRKRVPLRAPATFSAAASTSRGSRFPKRIGVGVTLVLVLLGLYFWLDFTETPPVIRELRERGNVVDFADKGSQIGTSNRSYRRRGSKILDNAGIHKVRIFVAQGIEPLAKHASTLTNLELLDLRETQLSDLTPLAELKHLIRLDLSATQVRDLTALRGMSQLTSLNVTATEVTDLAPLADLKKLGGLYISNTAVTDLSPIGQLSKLRSIELSNTQVGDLTPLAGLEDLHWVTVDHSQVTDLSTLIGLRHLERLAIDGTQLRNNLQVFEYLSSLKVLDLRTAEVTAEEVAKVETSLPECHVLQ